MKVIKIVTIFFLASLTTPVMSQINFARLFSGVTKVAQAMSLSDDQMAEYVREYVDQMDARNEVCGENDAYTIRLRGLTSGLNNADGIPLNFKVYRVKEANAFACADGSVRVYSSLMDIMSDEELLGVIGHEIGHVAHRDSKKSFRTALLTSALRDGLSSTNGKIAALTDSQLGELSEALVNAKYSQKQERKADDYGYEFLKKAGKNPWAMALSFRKLKEMQTVGSSSYVSNRINQLFSSHPDLESRIQRMEKRAIKDGIAKPTSATVR